MNGTKSLEVLVVENHRDTASCLRVYLETLGHRVIQAGSLAEAREKVRASDCDVLVCDVGLPDGDGRTVLKQVARPVYAIAMSGFGAAADRAESLGAGFRHHLTKPFALKQLDDCLAAAAAERGSLMQAGDPRRAEGDPTRRG